MSFLSFLATTFSVIVLFFVVLEVMPRLWHKGARLLDKWLDR